MKDVRNFVFLCDSKTHLEQIVFFPSLAMLSLCTEVWPYEFTRSYDVNIQDLIYKSYFALGCEVTRRGSCPYGVYMACARVLRSLSAVLRSLVVEIRYITWLLQLLGSTQTTSGNSYLSART